MKKDIKTILVTGGAGFIGSNFVRFMLNRYPDIKIINYDKLTYAGSEENLKDLNNNPNYEFIKGDVCDFNLLDYITKKVDGIINFAAESHVDNSYGDSLIYSLSNTLGTHTVLEVARKNNIKRMLHVSTDEVYGDKESGSFSEDDKLSPNNPYSASKAAAEMMVRSFYITYKMPILSIRGNNVYGPYQYPEKIIPKFISLLIDGKKVPIHGDGSNIRTYIFVEDFCEGVDTVFWKGNVGEVYNLGTDDEITNLDLTKKILKSLNKDESLIKFVPDRPFNDKRYSIVHSKIHALGWKQKYPFEKGFEKTINWYINNQNWWKPRLEFEIARKRNGE